MQSKTAMKSLFRTSLIALAGLSLSACSLFGDDDEEIKVAPLQPVANRSIPDLWNVRGDGIMIIFTATQR